MNKKYKEKIENLNFLELTPVLEIGFELDGNGLVNILIPRFSNKLLASIFMPRLKAPYIKMSLDEFGSVAWQNIDGKSNVDGIAKHLLDKFGEKIDPVEERLTKFLSQLYNYKFITFIELKNLWRFKWVKY